jgi:hypothetical protein
VAAEQAQAAEGIPVQPDRRTQIRQVPDGLLGPFPPGRFAERAIKVLLEVESAFDHQPRSDK